MQYNYIKELDNLHDDWLIHGKEHNSLVLDGQKQFETDKEHLNSLIAKIKSYIVENSNINNEQFFSSKQNENKIKEARKHYAK